MTIKTLKQMTKEELTNFDNFQSKDINKVIKELTRREMEAYMTLNNKSNRISKVEKESLLNRFETGFKLMYQEHWCNSFFSDL